MIKDEIEQSIYSKDYDTLRRILRESPGKVRILVSRLNTTDQIKLEAVLTAFQIAAMVLNEEKLLDLVRRLMWMLNEESGNNCPAAALALGHIAQVRLDAVRPHLPVLRLYAEDPSPMMSATVSRALAMIRNAEIAQQSETENS